MKLGVINGLVFAPGQKTISRCFDENWLKLDPFYPLHDALAVVYAII